MSCRAQHNTTQLNTTMRVPRQHKPNQHSKEMRETRASGIRTTQRKRKRQSQRQRQRKRKPTRSTSSSFSRAESVCERASSWKSRHPQCTQSARLADRKSGAAVEEPLGQNEAATGRSASGFAACRHRPLNSPLDGLKKCNRRVLRLQSAHNTKVPVPIMQLHTAALKDHILYVQI